MNIVENAPETNVNVRPQCDIECNAGLVVNRTDITFKDLSRDAVMIQVKIRNEGDQRSRAALIRLESAPFGAFVPWRPLATLPVPMLEPGESRELSVRTIRPHPKPLGDFDRVPPISVLTAQDAGPNERPPQGGGPLAATLLDLMRRNGTIRAENPTAPKRPTLSPDLWEYLKREQPHWAGNINVFVGDRAVERHCARALRIYPGRRNLAMFDVGGRGKPDAYSFELVGLAADWEAALHNVTGARALVVGPSDEPISEGKWVEASGIGMMLVMLAVRPPANCEQRKLEVHVTRRSCGKTAVVELDLDPTARGPGCYVA